MEIYARNTNELTPLVYRALQAKGALDQSRNGPVLRFLEPVTLMLTHPWERVNFCPVRDANPFFHLMEACAMLADENNTPFLSHFARQMAEYSDNGFTQNAFYGSRLRSSWGFDQLDRVIRNLAQHPHSRQEVALMWDPQDLIRETKDKACNLLLMFSIDAQNRTAMTSVNRSNDAIWGMINGANVVHLSLIHEYVACALGRPMAPWFHFTNNLHVYTENPKWVQIKDLTVEDQYPHLAQVRLFANPFQKPTFDKELRKFIQQAVPAAEEGDVVDTSAFSVPFIQDAAWLFDIWQMHRSGEYHFADLLAHLENVKADDWRWAARAWLFRRYNKAAKQLATTNAS